ncbi:MAG: FtsX-like permease family protein [Deltaproteobacteria bacterium]|nr:FtsX-like permease family protein [Deltaproteobacteria bacterium]
MGIFKLASMAWKNLWRHRRRTIITAFAIAFACFLAAIMIGMNDKSWEDVINTAARIGGGHITVQHPDYHDKPALNRTVPATAAKVKAITEIDGVKRALPRIVGQTMLSTTTESYGAGFIAYDPAVESTETLSILEALREGELFQSSKDKGIILGERLANNLGAEMGDKVVYTLTAKNGEIVSGLARVSGLVRTGSPAVDLGLCFLPLDAVRGTLGYDADEAVQIAVFLESQRESGRLVEEVAATLDDGSVALTWRQSQPDLDSFIAMKKGGGTFFSMLILLLCAAGIFNTLFVSVMERMREFGILVAVGFQPSKLFSLVMLESLWLGFVGVALGFAITAWPYYYLATTGVDLTEVYASSGQQMDIAGVGFSPILKIGLYPESMLAIIVIAMAATLLSGLYPAWKAVKVEPVETITLV